MIYGIVRISTSKQDTSRQKVNILSEYPDAVIVEDTYTGTCLSKSKKFKQLLNKLNKGDLLVFDSADRMSRNENEGWNMYIGLFRFGVDIRFLKDGYINTEVYRNAISTKLKIDGVIHNSIIGEFVATLVSAVNSLILKMAEEQVKQVFRSTSRQVKMLQISTSEGVQLAKLKGKQIGARKGYKLTTQKSIIAKEIIKANSIDFNGLLDDKTCAKLAKVCRNTFYKYKKELREVGN